MSLGISNPFGIPYYNSEYQQQQSGATSLGTPNVGPSYAPPGTIPGSVGSPTTTPTPGLNSAAYPFAPSGAPFSSGMPYLGGVVFIYSNYTSGVQLTQAHTLRTVPRQLIFLYKSKYIDWEAWKAWDSLNIYISFNQSLLTTDKVVVLVA